MTYIKSHKYVEYILHRALRLRTHRSAWDSMSSVASGERDWKLAVNNTETSLVFDDLHGTTDISPFYPLQTGSLLPLEQLVHTLPSRSTKNSGPI